MDQSDISLNHLGLHRASICRPCHPLCSHCTGYGLSLEICQTNCIGFVWYDQCVEQCPEKFYPHPDSNMCLPCEEANDDGTNVNCPPNRKLVDAIFFLLGATLFVGVIALVVAFAFQIIRHTIKFKKDLVSALSKGQQTIDDAVYKANLKKIVNCERQWIHLGLELESNNFATVYEASFTNKNERRHYVAKVPTRNKLDNSIVRCQKRERIFSEAYLMANLSHGNILSLHGMCLSLEPMIVTQCMAYGCLLHYIQVSIS